MPDLFEQLKQKYQPVLTKIQQEGAQLLNLNLDGNQLYLKATAVSEASKNRIWDAIKAVDPNFADLKHDIEARQGAQDYTVQPGDNLSKISKHFYGDANKYPVIAKANNLDDPDKIKIGQKLVIPAAPKERTSGVGPQAVGPDVCVRQTTGIARSHHSAGGKVCISYGLC